MKLSVQNNIPDSEQKDLAVSFARHFVKADFNSLRDILSDDVYIILFDRERKEGIESVLEYFKDWQSRVSDTFECEVRWSAQFSQSEIYFTSDTIKQAYILGIDNSRITRILLTPRSFSRVGLSIDEVPYNTGFIKANAPKGTEALANHFFCPRCGKSSELLDWSSGIIFRDGPGMDRKTGLFVNASICPDCNVVCEVSPDRSVRRCLAMTHQQQEKATAGMSEEKRAEYVDNCMGNKRPQCRSTLASRTNKLSEFGQTFFDLLDKIVSDNTPELVFSMLDKLNIGADKLKLHVASATIDDIGDESYLYVGDNENRGYRISKQLKAKPSIDAAWQIYLLHNSRTVMPVFWHGAYNLRDYIFDEAFLNRYAPLECYDMSGLSKADLLLPKITLSPNGRTADVYCTYWNGWKGLVRDHVQIVFPRIGKIRVTECEPLRLFEYHCGIYF